MVDNFWRLKNQVYNYVINSLSGLFADLICQKFMEINIDKFSLSDYFSTEAEIFIKLPLLKSLLTSESFWYDPRIYIELPPTHTIRSFYVDERTNFFTRNDNARYKQRRLIRRLELPNGLRKAFHRFRGEYSVSAIERANQFSNDRLERLRARLRQIVPPNEVVVTCGSYARREASASSDLDFFLITADPHLEFRNSTSMLGFVRLKIRSAKSSWSNLPRMGLLHR